MTDYAIGDIQGCKRTLDRLLSEIDFSPGKDTAFLVGDLVNRGPDSLGVLRWVMKHEDSVRVILGNHDLSLLRCGYGLARPKRSDTIAAVLAASDCKNILGWLSSQSLSIATPSYLFVHAGILPQWSADDVRSLSDAIQVDLRLAEKSRVLSAARVHQSTPWLDVPTDERLVVASKILTNIRVCNEIGEVAFSFSGAPQDCPSGMRPWYEHRPRQLEGLRVVAGHWSALGLYTDDRTLALDTGCVWGRQLTAFDLDRYLAISVDCVEGESARSLGE